MVEMVAKAKENGAGVHVLINNAGVLRDKSFAKMEPADFKFRGRCPSQRIGQLHQGGVGDDARTELRPHPDDRIVDRACSAISARRITARPSSASPG
jgi:NAD(P)-dependent dehydrogenase (short-subunit alcohol dehydrogenase family)